MLSRPDSLAGSKPVSHSQLSSFYQKSRIFHLDVPQIHVHLDKKTVLAEKIVAEAIERAERELSSTSQAADSGIGQEAAPVASKASAQRDTGVSRVSADMPGQQVSLISLGFAARVN